MYNWIMSEPYSPDPSRMRATRPLPPVGSADPGLSREELAATIEARRELGPQYEHALVDRLADQVDRVVEAQTARRTAGLSFDQQAAKNSLTLAIVSLGCGIPITAIAAGITHLPGVIVAWGGIVGVNLAHAWATRRRRR
jgi:hypothetical protein